MTPIEIAVVLGAVVFWSGFIREWRRIQGRLDRYVGKGE